MCAQSQGETLIPLARIHEARAGSHDASARRLGPMEASLVDVRLGVAHPVAVDRRVVPLLSSHVPSRHMPRHVFHMAGHDKDKTGSLRERSRRAEAAQAQEAEGSRRRRRRRRRLKALGAGGRRLEAQAAPGPGRPSCRQSAPRRTRFPCPARREKEKKMSIITRVSMCSFFPPLLTPLPLLARCAASLRTIKSVLLLQNVFSDCVHILRSCLARRRSTQGPHNMQPICSLYAAYMQPIYIQPIGCV